MFRRLLSSRQKPEQKRQSSDEVWVFSPVVTSVIADQFFLPPYRIGNKKPVPKAQAG